MFKFLEEVGQVIEVELEDHGINSCKKQFDVIIIY